LTGLAFGSRCNLCSVNSLGTPSTSAGFKCKDVPIFLEEFDEQGFLFVVQIVAYVSHLRRFLRGQRDCLAECVLWLDGRLGSPGLGHDQVRGELDQGLLQLLELCRFQQSISSFIAPSIAVESPLDVSPEGCDTTRSWHLQD
jgi:hypothetical protein